MLQTYRTLCKERNYMLVLSANFINRLGDVIDMMAFTWLTYQLTNSASWASIMFGVNNLPTLMMPFAGALVEKLRKKWILIISDVLRGCMTAWIAVLYWNGDLTITYLLIITFLNNTMECFRIPASKGLLPHILNKAQYEHGLSLDTSLSKATELIGIAVSGSLIAWIGVQGAIMIDVATFLLSACILVFLSLQEPASTKTQWSLHSYAQTLKDGFRYALHQPLILLLIGCCIICNALLVPINSYQAAYISGTLHQNADLLSYTSLALSLGMCVGAFFCPWLHKRWSAKSIFLYPFYSLALYDCAMWVLPYIQEPLLLSFVFILISFVLGLCMGASTTTINVALIKQIDPMYMSRMSATTHALSASAMPLVSFLLGAISIQISVPVIFLIFGFFTFFAITVMMFSNKLKEM